MGHGVLWSLGDELRLHLLEWAGGPIVGIGGCQWLVAGRDHGLGSILREEVVEVVGPAVGDHVR